MDGVRCRVEEVRPSKTKDDCLGQENFVIYGKNSSRRNGSAMMQSLWYEDLV